ncbi:MAG: hypothetical protein OHK0022_11940 [Roseiflexaceae bacterium]
MLAALTPQQRVALEERLLAEGERFNIFPLSVAQERLWFSVRRAGATSMHHIHGALWAEGLINPELLARSLGDLIDRHEILRTTFHLLGSQPRQAISPPGSLVPPLSVIERSGLGLDEQIATVLSLAVEQRETPFDLGQGPLLRVALVLLAPRRAALLFTIHHLICDGWSMNIFLRELAQIYTALLDGQLAALPSLPIQYADFAVWQRQELRNLADQPAFQSWRARLAQSDLLIDLPQQRLRPPQRSFCGAICPLVLPADLVERLRQFARDEQATLFMALLAVLQALLFRYSGQRRFVIGTYSANRSRPELTGLIGDCTNILALPADLTGDELTFRALLGRVRDLVLEAQRFAAVPSGQLVTTVWPQIDHSQHAAFPVMFNFFPYRASASLQVPGLALEAIEVPQEQTAMPFDLQFSLWSSGHDHSGYLEYDTDLFAAEQIAALAQHLQTLFAAVVHEPDRPLAALELAPAPAVAPASTPGPVDLPRHLLELARSRPDAVALDDPQRGKWNYAQLCGAATALARAIQKAGLSQGQAVRLDRRPSVELVVGLLGALFAGAVCVVGDPAPDRPDGAVLLTSEQIGRWLAEASVVPVDADGLPGAEQDACAFVGGSGDAALALSHRALAELLDAYARACGLGPDDRSLCHPTAAPSAALVGYLLPLFSGATLCLAPQEAPPTPDLLERLGVTCALLPAALLAGPAWAGLPSLRALILTGDPLTLPARLAERPNCRLCWAVGPLGLPLWPIPARLLPDGQIQLEAAGTQILSDQLVPVPCGAEGTLFVGGGARPALPRSSTGLRVREAVAGQIVCLGRPEERLSRRGLRVWPSELAHLLRGVAGIDDLLVAPDPGSPQRLVVYAILSRNAGRSVVAAEVQRLLAQTVPPALRPAALVALPDWPLGPDGGIARGELPVPAPGDAFQSQLSTGDSARLSRAKQELLARRLRERTPASELDQARKGDEHA